MAKNKFNFTINLDLGKSGNSPPRKKVNTKKPGSSILVRELKALRKDMNAMIEKTGHSGNSILVSELRGLKKEISTLPHVAHSGGG